MKKAMILAVILILCIAGFTAGAYIKAMGPKKEAETEAFKKAQKEGGFVTMDDYYLYHGNDSYSVVVGKTKSGKKKVIWLPDNKKEKPVIEDSKSGKTRGEILSIVKKQLNPQKIISVKLGMENNVPLWEVTYLDESSRYNYNYYDFKTGEWLKYYRSI
ncbi:DUF5590 domain-containing protein [Peribacillus sp. B-H-3]|uniref:cell wall elongation regulator TseB-like domain-containing protein n=1 Tax=Peribacillus sp. B-H-3 TaxID=3400420 RepID=UPI003B021995